MIRATVFAIAVASSHAILVKKHQPVLKLRGGLAGIDAEMTAKIVMGISAANAGVMSLAPTKAGEMYGVTSTKWTDFFAQWGGLVMAGQVLTAFLALGGMDLGAAAGWGFIPSAIASVQDLLNDRMVGSLGMSAMAKFMPTLVNVVLTLGCFGMVPNLSADNTLKFATVWMGLNGLFGYFATGAWLDQWGASGLSAVDSAMGKFMASTMVGSAAYLASSVFMGKSALESFGVMMLVYALSSVDGLYISKTMESMNVEPAKGLFWAALQALTAAVIFV